MKKATIISFKGIDDTYHSPSFSTIGRSPNIWFSVKSFENGIVTIEPAAGTDIEYFADAVAGCVHKESNFCSEVRKACNKKSTVTGIKFTHNGITVMVTKENADKGMICEAWEKAREARVKKRRF